MFESLESRQLFSATLTATALTAEPTPTAAVEADATTTQARKAGSGQHEYLIVKLKEVYVTGVSF